MNILIFDFETSYTHNKPWQPEAYPVSLGIECHANEVALYHDFILNHRDSPPTFDLNLVQGLFDDADEIVAHNLCFDLHWLRKCGIKLKKNIRLFDTMIAEYLLCGQTKKYDELSLADLSDKYLETPKDDKVKIFWDAGYETDQIPLGILLPYMKRDVINTRNIYHIQQELIEQKGMGKLVRLQSELVGVVEDMEWNGMLVDLDTCKRREEECLAKAKELECELTMFIEEALPELWEIPIKWTSGDHLSIILFGGGLVYNGKESTERVLKDGTIKYGERNAKLTVQTKGLGFTPGKGTATKKEGFYQTDKAQMEQLKPKGKQQRRFLDILEEISSMEKLAGTYFGPFQAESIGGVFHPNFNQTATVTGRLTCSRLHQIPRDADTGVKGVFLSGYPKY